MNLSPTKKQILGALGLFVILLALMFILHRHLPQRVVYPPTSDDQRGMYLQAGQIFADYGTFFQRAPGYSAWLGLVYLASNRDLRSTFYIDKYSSTFILIFLIACLGWRLFDFRTGVLLGFWGLNCKYLILESNGSHTFAACFFAGSLLSLLIKRDALRLPVALLLLFLSAQARSEMYVALWIVLAVLAIQLLLRWRKGQLVISRGATAWALGTLVLCVALYATFVARRIAPEPNRMRETFCMSFALNYIERNNLPKTIPAQQIWADVFPAISPPAAELKRDASKIDVVGTVLHYPKEIASHFIYNIKLAVRALPAMVIGIDRLLLVLGAFVLYLASFFVWKPKPRWPTLPAIIRQQFWLWSLASLALIPISLVLNVVARYYIQLLPVLMIGIVMALHAGFRMISKPSPQQ